MLLTGAATAHGLVLGPALAVVAARLSPGRTGVADSAPAPQLVERLATPRGVGFGDVKLAGILGMYGGWLGWSAWTLSLLTASLYAGAVGVVLLASGRAGLRSRVAMGPYLVAGALTAALVGQQLLDGAVTL